MFARATSDAWLTGRRAARRRRREIRDALRGEWQLEPRVGGWVRVRTFAKQVGELEQARLVAHADAARRPPARRLATASPRDGAPAGTPGPHRAKHA